MTQNQLDLPSEKQIKQIATGLAQAVMALREWGVIQNPEHHDLAHTEGAIEDALTRFVIQVAQE